MTFHPMTLPARWFGKPSPWDFIPPMAHGDRSCFGKKVMEHVMVKQSLHFHVLVGCVWYFPPANSSKRCVSIAHHRPPREVFPNTIRTHQHHQQAPNPLQQHGQRWRSPRSTAPTSPSSGTTWSAGCAVARQQKSKAWKVRDRPLDKQRILQPWNIYIQ